MKTSSKFILTCMLSLLCLVRANAQGLSLSFNLSETDTLENMIAESKKYDITSLTLSGYVNDVNVSYIKDLNSTGKLDYLDLSDVTYVSAKLTQTRVKKVGSWSDLVSCLNEFDWPDAEGLCGTARSAAWRLEAYDILTYNSRVWLKVICEDMNTEQSFKKTIKIGVIDNGKERLKVGETVSRDYDISMPKKMFDKCHFSVFYTPRNLETIGGKDCSFRLAKCSEYHLGENIRTIGENAFKNSQVDKLILSSPVDSICSSAFENTVGNVFATPDYICAAKFIGKTAFKSYQNAVLPDVISLRNIEEICDSAFVGSPIKGIELGDNIDSIRHGVFANCTELQRFKGGQNVIYIGKNAFVNCKKLKDISEMTKLCKIDEKAFEHCELLESFTPSNALSSIGNEAFAYNMALPKFTLPETMKEVGLFAFAYSGIKEFDLGKYSEYRGDLIVGCDSLETITVSADNEKLKSEEGVLFTKDGKILLAYPPARKQPLYEIENSVVEIADSAFYGARILNSLGIGESISKIGKNAFANSNIFELKVLPSKVPALTETLGVNQQIVRLFVHEKDYSTYYIANYWGDFKNIFIIENTVSPDNIINVEIVGTLPSKIGFGNQFKYNALKLSGSLNSDDVRYLREMAGRTIDGNPTSGVLTDLDFSQASIVSGGSGYYQKSTSSSGTLTTKENIIGESMFEGCHLEKISISDNATSISAKAFSGCPLKEFLVPSGVTSIGSQAFAGATLSSFSAPAALVSISLDSFYGMGSLKEINVESENKTYLSIDNVLFTKDGTSLLLYPYGKEGEKYIIPETVTKINEQAFGGNILKVVTANEGLKEIGTLAFDNLASLEAISLPSTLERIGHRAFWGCNHLMDISCKAYYPPTLGYNSSNYFGQPYNNFSDRTYENAVLLVPEKNGGYKSRSGWKLFNNTIESDDWMTGIITTRGIGEVRVEKYYDMSGREVKSMPHGINIVKMSDGSTRKVMVK